MLLLNKNLRNAFEQKIKEAREISEKAAFVILNQLGIGESKPYSYLNEGERILRRSLRAHGRQLGDKLDDKTQKQEINRLIEEVAYEHWHRMLFAKFLAENNLLMYPDPDEPIAISLDECEDLAIEEGAKDGWELAAKYAEHMLPQIFNSSSILFELDFPPEYQQKLESILNDLPKEVFTSSDSLGWVYQFWQTKNKEVINNSGKKIGKRELPAVTQLFTDPYMVNFILDNTIGAWWANKCLQEGNLSHIEEEQDLRSYLSTAEIHLEYTRFVKDLDGNWMVASGNLDHWPVDLKNFKLLDPSCGSGHFLVGAFLKLVPIRMKIEGLTSSEAIDAVLQENLYGLDIDKRVVEIAVFALALVAWKYPNGGGYRILPDCNVACVGLDIGISKEEWLSLGDNQNTINSSLALLYDEFKYASTLGSLINPAEILEQGGMFNAQLYEVRPYIDSYTKKSVVEEKELGLTAQGLIKAAEILTNKFTLVTTNVPYLKGGEHDSILKEFCEKNYPDSKYDLATVFIERCMKLLIKGGTLAVVTQQYWLFLKYYEKLRAKFISRFDLGLIARLGSGAFATISGEVVNICLQITHNRIPGLNHEHYGIEIDAIKGIENKNQALKNSPILIKQQRKQLNNPDKRISFELSFDSNKALLSKYADFGKGSVTGDSPHYLRKFWEVDMQQDSVRRWLNSPNSSDIWSGREHIVLWDEEKFNPQNEVGFRLHGQRVWGKNGVIIGKAGNLRFSPYSGELFDDNLVVISPLDENNLQALWEYCTSSDFEQNLRMLDKKMSVTAGTFTKVPFNEETLKQEINPYLEIYHPYTNDPTQWLFHGFPVETKEILQVLVARMLGFKWPVELLTDICISNKTQILVDKCKELDKHVDKDGIVCIPSIFRESSAADRMLDFLISIYGYKWDSKKLSQIMNLVNSKCVNLESWLRNDFFKQHLQLFHQKPFIWQIWDGLDDGFSVLVNYQKLNKSLLEKLIYTYLGDWIKKQKGALKEKIDGAEEKLLAAENLKKKLELILEGEAPYDIFIRWKSLSNQPLGWNPDLNDGIRMNIRPFMTVPDVKKKGAGVLREKPSINWNKDRGKDLPTAPWFNLFEGERINNHHLSLEEKRVAREKVIEIENN